MPRKDDITLLALVRSRPVESGVLLFCPLAVSALQLLNSHVNDLSYAVSVPFAIVLVAFAVMLARTHLAEFHRVRLDAETIRSMAD